jgi:hypothetical protein
VRSKSTDPHRLLAPYRAAEQWLQRIDPNDDPTAEPLTLASVVALTVAIVFSTSLFIAFKVQPMQDLGHHLALAAAHADRGRPGSLFTDLYEPLDVFSANSLLYVIAAPMSRVMGVTTAVRALMGFYVVGVPIATAWALRAYGRPIWSAVLSTAFVYNMVYLAGFANLLLAAPFMILSLPVLDRALQRRTMSWIVGAIAIYCAVLLSHAQAFLWTGFLAATLTVARMFGAAPHRPWRERLREVAAMAVTALAAVAPSLVLFVRWYRRTFSDRTAVMTVTASAENNFGAYWKTPRDVLAELTTVTVKWFQTSDADMKCWMMVIALGAFATALARMQRRRALPVLELACAMTLGSYFVLPEGLTNQDVVASRQVSLALWFAPALFAPVSAQTSRWARWLVIWGTLWVTGQMLVTWRTHLRKFSEETHGLLGVLSHAPPRKWLHYVKSEPDSAVFTWHQLVHVDKYYSSNGFGQIADTPAIHATSAMRYKPGIDIHRIGEHSEGWVFNDDIWRNFDLILLRRPHPSPPALATMQSKGRLLAAEGDWQLWQSSVVKR